MQNVITIIMVFCHFF